MNYFAVGHLRRRRRRAGDGQPQPGALQRLQVQPPRGAAGVRRPRHPADRAAGRRRRPAAARRAPGRASERRRHARPTASTCSRFLRPRPRARKRLKVVVDAANGMGSHLPADPRGGRHRPRSRSTSSSTAPSPTTRPTRSSSRTSHDLCRRVRETGADLGVAFDGDADRAAFVDERGEPIGSDLATALIAGELLDARAGQGRPLRPALVARGGRVHPGEGRHPGARARRPLLHEGDAARAPTASSAASSPATTTSATTTTPTARWLAVFEILNLLRSSGKPHVRARRAAAALRQEPGDQLRGRGQGRARCAELARRFADGEIDYLDGITVQYPDWWFNVRPSNTEPLPAAGARGRHRREAGGEEGDPGRVPRRAGVGPAELAAVLGADSSGGERGTH